MNIPQDDNNEVCIPNISPKERLLRKRFGIVMFVFTLITLAVLLALRVEGIVLALHHLDICGGITGAIPTRGIDHGKAFLRYRGLRVGGDESTHVLIHNR